VIPPTLMTKTCLSNTRPPRTSDGHFRSRLSEAGFDRTGLTQLVDFARPGDIVCVVRLDRLGRSLKELLAILLALLLFAPQQSMPIHWNLDGQPDRSADKWVVMALAGGLYLALVSLPRLDPGRANYAQFSGAHSIIRLAVLTLVVVLTGSSIFGLRGADVTHLAIGAMLIVIGGVLGKIRPNWFVGIRTPWTLTSKRSWLKTHRLGGWLFMAWGFLELLTGPVLPGGRAVTLAYGGAVLAILVIYSYVVWRDDPDKLPAVGTQPANGNRS